LMQNKWQSIFRALPLPGTNTLMGKYCPWR